MTNLRRIHCDDRVATGEEIVIAGKPKAKLVSYRTGKKRRGTRKLLGITYIANDFGDPLSPEMQIISSRSLAV